MKAAAKKVLIGIGGGLIVLAGIAMIILPGPAFLVIPAGLAILATEFVWADRLMQKLKQKAGTLRWRLRRQRWKPL